MQRLLFLIFLVLAGHTLEAHRVFFGTGIYDRNRSDTRCLETRLEFRWDHTDTLKPLVGFSSNSRGSTYSYCGLYYDWFFTKNKKYFLTPSFSIGYYAPGSGKDLLGHPMEFRSQIELGVVLTPLVQGSLGLAHISNCHMAELQYGKKNQGTEHIFLTFSFRL